MPKIHPSETDPPPAAAGAKCDTQTLKEWDEQWRADLDKALENVFTDELVAKLDKEHGDLLRSIIVLPTQERGRKKRK